MLLVIARHLHLRPVRPVSTYASAANRRLSRLLSRALQLRPAPGTGLEKPRDRALKIAAIAPPGNAETARPSFDPRKSPRKSGPFRQRPGNVGSYGSAWWARQDFEPATKRLAEAPRAPCVSTIVDGNAVQAAMIGCPQSSECCPPCVGIRVRFASDSAIIGALEEISTFRPSDRKSHAPAVVIEKLPQTNTSLQRR